MKVWFWWRSALKRLLNESGILYLITLELCELSDSHDYNSLKITETKETLPDSGAWSMYPSAKYLYKVWRFIKSYDVECYFKILNWSKDRIVLTLRVQVLLFIQIYSYFDVKPQKLSHSICPPQTIVLVSGELNSKKFLLREHQIYASSCDAAFSYCCEQNLHHPELVSKYFWQRVLIDNIWFRRIQWSIISELKSKHIIHCSGVKC